MNKNDKIQEIERKQRELADQLEQLRKEEESPEPICGEVWKDPYGRHALMYKNAMSTQQGTVIIKRNGNENHPPHVSNRGVWTWDDAKAFGTRLGTFDEVYIEREKVAKLVEKVLARLNIIEGGTYISVHDVRRELQLLL